jgi:hypothetical protein
MESLREHESFWLNASPISELHTWGIDPQEAPEPAPWDYQALGDQAQHDIAEITPLLESVLEPGLFVRLKEVSASPLQLDDELWVRTVYDFAAAIRHGRGSVEHLADMFVPIYLWRASAFMARTEGEPAAVVQQRLDTLCDTFQRLKPALVASWSKNES